MRLGLAAATIFGYLATIVTANCAELGSASRIAFGPQNVMFVADWKGAQVVALTLPPAPTPNGKTFNILDLDVAIRVALKSDDYLLSDMAMRPGTDEAYLVLAVGPRRQPRIVVARPDGTLRVLNWKQLHQSSAPLENAPDDSLKFWDKTGRSFTATDMIWYGGKLYVAGLSNQTFASTLRILPYPFGATAAQVGIEIYHTSHNQIETRAPINAMQIVQLGGKPYLLAAYLCTPLVTIPLDALQNGTKVTGKTIAELGDAGSPLKIVSYGLKSWKGDTAQYVLVANQYQQSEVIPLSSIEEANAKPGLDKPVPSGQVVGVSPTTAQINGALRVDNQDDDHFVVLRRQPDSGHSQLVSVDKKLMFRISDFEISEFMFPDYQYGDWQNRYLKGGQNKLKREEGHAESVRP